jgi:GLPGLI family protein
MKRYILFTLFTVAVVVVYGQSGIDAIIYRCTYRAITVKDTTDVTVFSEDIMHLDIGGKLSHFYSQRKQQLDSVLRKAIETGTLDRDILKTSPKGVNKYVIYRNYPEGKITFLNEIAGKRTRYKYEEDAPQQSWEILSDKSTILGYSCQKAVCLYRGREYTAWFTTELPFASGPWKFGGLPGLILKISDTKGHYSFEAVGFEKVETEAPILFSGDEYRKIDRKNYLKIELDYLRDPVAWINQNTGVKIEGISTPQERKNEGFREDHYAPLELE